jgi:hypothetical protein
MKLSDLIKKLQELQTLDAGYDPTVYGLLDGDEKKPCVVDDVTAVVVDHVVIKFSRLS